MNSLSSEELYAVETDFLRSMRNNYRIWGEQTFRRHMPEQVNKSVVNVAMFDVLSVLFAKLDEGSVNEIKDEARRRLYKLQSNIDFLDSITKSTNDLKQVKVRFSLAQKTFGGIL